MAKLKIKAPKAPGAELAQSVAAVNKDPQEEAKQKAYETDGHLKTLTDAFDIMRDPAKMERVHKLAGRRHNAIKSLSDLKARANSAFQPDNDGDVD